MSDFLPIAPGSVFDTQINDLVKRWAEGEGTDEHGPHLVQVLEVENPAHILAFGTRLWLARAGVTDPMTLTASLYAQWYGSVR